MFRFISNCGIIENIISDVKIPYIHKFMTFSIYYGEIWFLLKQLQFLE